MAGAVSHRVDAVGRGRAPFVDHDPVVATDSRRGGQLRVGNDADSYHDHVRGNDVACAPHALDRPVALERHDSGGKPDVDAAGSMSARVVGGHLGSGHPPENPVRGFDDADLEPQPFRGRGNLEPDVSSTDDDQPPPRHQHVADGVRVRQRSQVEDVPQIRPRGIEPARAASGRDDKVRERDRLAVLEQDRPAFRVDLPDRVSEPELDVVPGVKVLRAQENACQRELAGQVLLRQRRSLVRRHRLGAAHDDAALVPGLTQTDRGLAAGMTGTGDDGGGHCLPPRKSAERTAPRFYPKALAARTRPGQRFRPFLARSRTAVNDCRCGNVASPVRVRSRSGRCARYGEPTAYGAQVWRIRRGHGPGLVRRDVRRFPGTIGGRRRCSAGRPEPERFTVVECYPPRPQHGD